MNLYFNFTDINTCFMTWTFDICLKNRKILEGFLNQFSLKELNKVPEGFNNNIIWNIAHVIVTQQLLVYSNSQLPMIVSDEMVAKYRKGTFPEFSGMSVCVYMQDVFFLVDVANCLKWTTRVAYAKHFSLHQTRSFCTHMPKFRKNPKIFPEI